MPTVNNGAIIEATLSSLYQNSRVLNVFHYRISGLGEPVDYQTLMEVFVSEFILKLWTDAAGLKQMVVNTYTLLGARAQAIYPVRHPYYEEAVGEVGDVSGAGIPSISTGVLTLRSEVVLPGSSGSKHFTGFPVTTLNGGLWQAAHLLEMVALAELVEDSIVTMAPAAAFEPVIFNKTSNTAAEIIQVTANTEVRTMHRRTVGLGI